MVNPVPPLDREKYLKIARAEGVNAALTALHRDTETWEFETFEGKQGYSEEGWKRLEEVRDFSREIWQLGLEQLGK
jgi:hypothetical protein